MTFYNTTALSITLVIDKDAPHKIYDKRLMVSFYGAEADDDSNRASKQQRGASHVPRNKPKSCRLKLAALSNLVV